MTSVTSRRHLAIQITGLFFQPAVYEVDKCSRLRYSTSFMRYKEKCVGQLFRYCYFAEEVLGRYCWTASAVCEGITLLHKAGNPNNTPKDTFLHKELLKLKEQLEEANERFEDPWREGVVDITLAAKRKRIEGNKGGRRVRAREGGSSARTSEESSRESSGEESS